MRLLVRLRGRDITNKEVHELLSYTIEGKITNIVLDRLLEDVANDRGLINYHYDWIIEEDEKEVHDA